MSKRFLAAVAATTLVAVLAAGTSSADRGNSSSDSLVLSWYDLTAQAVTAAGLPEQASQERIWAVSWLAAARATHAPSDPRYVDAALATALHDTLVSLVPVGRHPGGRTPASVPCLDPRREREESRGRSGAGRKPSRHSRERANDGLDTASVNRAWTPPAAAPGVYQLTGGPAVRAGLPDAKPFIIASSDDFDPGPPPSLTSQRYLTDLAEIHALGASDSTLRTPAQTDIARFWAQSSLLTYTQVLRQVIAAEDRPATAARLVAAFHVIQIDQQIAIHAAKYRYLFWRPVTAITTGAVDRDPNWQPLIATPRHPEYPSGHAGFGGTAEVVLEALAPAQAHRTFSAASATDGGAVHTWRGWAAITDETIDARVWEGVHFRSIATRWARSSDAPSPART